MDNKFSVRPRGIPMLRAIRIAAMIALVGAGAALPAGAVGARSNAPMGPCLPVAVDDSYSTDQDVPLSVGAPAGVKANDADCGLDVQVTSTTANGSLTLNPDGSFDYTPDAGFSGPDGFDYIYEVIPVPTFAGGSATEGAGRRPQGVVESGHVDIDVIPAPVPTEPPCVPVAIDDAYETPQDVVLDVGQPGVKVNDTHCEFFVHLFSNPTNGTLVLNADGTFQYTPNAGFTGVDTFEYALAEIAPGFASGPRLDFRRQQSAWRAPQGAADNVATVTITITGTPPTTTSTTTPTTTTVAPPTPTPTTTTPPPPAVLPATR